MKLQIPAQLRGRDAARLMPAAVRLRKEMEPAFGDLGGGSLHRITTTLRVGGELGSFGDDAVENIEIDGAEAGCDIVIRARDWNRMEEEQIYLLLKARVLEALDILLDQADHPGLPDGLR